MRDSSIINISINQLADFSIGTDGKRKGIIRQQKNPNPFKVSWYQLSKARIRKSIAHNGDLEPILSGIEELKLRKTTSKRQNDDRVVSLEAMQKFIQMGIPKILQHMDYEIVKKSKEKSIFINGVEIIVAPDLIVKAELDGKMHYGAIKIHVAKHNMFDRNQQSLVATAIYKYLESLYTEEGTVILPEMCLSIDIFGGNIVSAPNTMDDKINDLEVICDEVKRMWFAA